MNTTKIEWAEATWNPVTGCTKISPGCKNCYASVMARRLQAMGTPGYENGFKVTLHPERLGGPLKWKKGKRIFVCSMGDLFHDDVPFEFIDRVMDVIRECSQHTFLVLTKRAARMAEYFAGLTDGSAFDRLQKLPYYQSFHGVHLGYRTGKPMANLWLGVTAEDQQRADERIPYLRQCPAVVRFISVEPLLGPIDLSRWIGYNPVHEDQQTGGNGGTGSDTIRRDGSGFQGENLENRQARMGPLEEIDGHSSMSPGEGGAKDSVGLFAGGDHAGQETYVHGCASRCPPISRGANTGRDDHKPQERSQGRQPAGKSGSDDVFRQHEARQSSADDRAGGEPVGRAEPSSQVDRGSGQTCLQGNASHRGRNENSTQPHDQRIGGAVRGRIRNRMERGSQSPLAISLIIVGGESGPHARPMDPEWARAARDQCRAAGVPFLFKQWGEWLPIHRDPGNYCCDHHCGLPKRMWEYPGAKIEVNRSGHIRVGKKLAGRLLDGVLHDEYPAGKDGAK